jgi:hypothetical protein
VVKIIESRPLSRKKRWEVVVNEWYRYKRNYKLQTTLALE